MTGQSTSTVLLIEDGSMSMWMILRVRGEAREVAGHAVVEAGADGDQQVALLHGVVGVARAVHAEHVERLRVGRRERAQAQQRAA